MTKEQQTIVIIFVNIFLTGKLTNLRNIKPVKIPNTLTNVTVNEKGTNPFCADSIIAGISKHRYRH